MSEPTTGDLFAAPDYPGQGADPADARRWLGWKMGIGDLAGVAFYANPNDVLRQAIQNYGESVIAGCAPNGRVETMRELYARVLGSFDKPKVPKAKTPKRWVR